MSDLLSKIPQFEPLRKNRWILRFPSDLGIQEWWLASASRPTITINEVEVPLLNTSDWVAGRFIWEPIDVVLRDPIGPSASQAVMEWIRLHAESATGRMGYAVGYKRDVELDMLDPTGVVVQKWLLQGCMATTGNFGDLAMDDDSLADITLTLRFPRAILLF